MSESKVIEIAELESVLKKHDDSFKTAIEEANKEAAERLANGLDGVRSETAGKLEEIAQKMAESAEKLAEIQQKGIAVEQPEMPRDMAAEFVESEQFKAFAEGRQGSASVEHKTAILNTYPASTSQPLVQGDRRPGIITNPDRVLRISDLLPHIPTSSNNVEYAKENVFTNNAGPQYGTASPTQIENVAKNESGVTFTLEQAPVITVAHFIPASRQVLSDSPMLEGFIRQRLSYGLMYNIEDQILNGDGSSGQLDGLLNNATAVPTSASGTDTKVDVVRNLITQLQISEYMAGGAVVLNPADWGDIETVKTSDNAYVWANPANQAQPRLWGLPVVVTNSITAGTVLVGDFMACGAVYDREAMTIEASREHSDNFTKNMVTILAEARLALAVHRTSALKKATF